MSVTPDCRPDVPQDTLETGRQQAIAELARRAVLPMPLSELLQCAAETVAQYLRVDLPAVFGARADCCDLVLLAGVGWPPGLVGEAVIAATQGSQIEAALSGGAPVAVTDLASDQRFSTPRLLVEQGAMSGLVVPIPGAQRLLGVIAAHHRRPRQYTGEDASFLEAVANVLGLAMERSRADQLLERTHGDLERQVAQRTSDLVQANTRLRREIKIRHKAAQALEKILARADLAVAGADDGLWHITVRPGQTWYASSNPIWLSPRCKELLGFRAEELEGTLEAWQSRVHPQDREQVQAAAAAHLRDGTAYDIEYRLRTKSGSYRWFRVRGRAVRNRAGRVTEIAGSLHDVTEHKEVEAALNSYLRYLEAMDDISGAIARSASLEQMVTEVVQRLRRIFGVDRAWLLHPCQPYSHQGVRVEDTHPDYPGAAAALAALPPEAIKEMTETALGTLDPVVFGGKQRLPRASLWRRTFAVQSSMVIALRPRSGEPWLLGLHQCRYEREWTREDRELFKGISYRLTDALTSLLLHQDLRQSEERYRSLFENSVDGIFVSAPDGQMLDANPALCRMLGCDDRRELIRRADQQWRQFRDLHRARLAAGAAGIQAQLSCHDGRHIWVEIRTQPVYSKDAQVRYYQSIVRDVTEAKRAQQELMDSERKFRVLAESVPAAIWFYDGDTLLYANSAAMALTAALGSGLERLHPLARAEPELAQAAVETHQRGPLQSRPVFRREAGIGAGDGQTRWVDYMTAAINYNGRPATLHTAFDITERKNAQAQLVRLIEENRQLLRQCLIIQEQERKSLAHDLHDELGQYLTAIKADAVSIARRSADRFQEIHEGAKAIVTACNHLHEVLRYIMQQLRPAAIAELGLVETLRSTAKRWQAHHHGISCRFRAQGELGDLGDAVNITLYRVMQECLTNVARHAHATKVEVNLARCGAGRRGRSRHGRQQGTETTPGASVQLTVRDNGKGYSETAGPPGLGLLGMRERVTSLGGGLTLTSRPGGGTCVSAVIPIRHDIPVQH